VPNTSKANEIYNLLSPFVAKGSIVKRTSAEILADIDKFITLKQDDKIIACCLLRKHKSCYEMSAFAVHQDYQGQGLGDKLLAKVENKASGKLIALSKYQGLWFIKHNFQQITYDELPAEINYNQTRKPNIFYKCLNS
jgi:amino-acid N-acetyltransferase